MLASASRGRRGSETSACDERQKREEAERKLKGANADRRTAQRSLTECEATLAETQQQLRTNLLSVVNYTQVAQDVAQYGKDMFLQWTQSHKNWESDMHKSGLRWDKSWNHDPQGAIAAVKAWMQAPAEVLPCRHATAWPPPPASSPRL